MKSLGLKKIHLFFSSLFICLLHLPFVFAKSKPKLEPFNNALTPAPTFLFDSTGLLYSPDEAVLSSGMYDQLKLASLGLAKQAFDYALKGYDCLRSAGKIANQNIISIVDFTKPSSQKRLFIIDLKNCRVLFNTYVAHGVNSGKEFARQFSNIPESNQSSLGFYKTADTYNGKNGYSLHLQGMERGINDNAYKRDIVIHGADYVNENLIRANGCIGRSWGCPAVPEKFNKQIIDKIKNGTCLFIFGGDKKYFSRSALLKNETYALAYNR